MNAAQAPENVSVHDTFASLVEAYNEMLEVNSHQMPPELVVAAYSQFGQRLTALNVATQEHFTNHRYWADILVSLRTVNLDVVQIVPNQTIMRVRVPKRTTRALKRAEIETQMPDNCSICLDQYIKINAIVTNCGHHFCKSCYESHETACLEKETPVVQCPMCRNADMQIMQYRARKTRAGK